MQKTTRSFSTLFLKTVFILFVSILTCVSCDNSSSTSKRSKHASSSEDPSSSSSSKSRPVIDTENIKSTLAGLKEGTYTTKCLKNETEFYTSEIQTYKLDFTIQITTASTPTIIDQVTLYSDSKCTNNDSNKVASFDITSVILSASNEDSSNKIYQISTDLEKAVMTPYKSELLQTIANSAAGSVSSLLFPKDQKDNQPVDITSNPILINIISGIVGSDITSSDMYLKDKSSAIVIAGSKKDLDDTTKSFELSFSE